MVDDSAPDPTIEELKKRVGFGLKFWLEFEIDVPQEKRRKKAKTHDKNILGSGWANLLKTIKGSGKLKEKQSLTQAAEECGYSYKYAWNILSRIKEKTGMSPVTTSKGGRGGGGWIELSEWGTYLLETYETLKTELEKVEQNLQKSLIKEK